MKVTDPDFGTTRTMTRTYACKDCNGTGETYLPEYDLYRACTVCDGKGYIQPKRANPPPAHHS